MENPLKWETEYIIKRIAVLVNGDARFNNMAEEEINAVLDEENWAERFHGKFILDAIFSFLEANGCPCSRLICERYLGSLYYGEPEFLSFSDYKGIPTICEESHIDFLNSQYVYRNSRVIKTTSKKHLVDKGAVYTQTNIVHSIVENTLKNLSHDVEPDNIRVLDFATGTGRFYTEVVKYISEHYNIDTEKVALNNVYAIDLDPIALNITRLKAFLFLHDYQEEHLSRLCESIILRNGLLRESLSLMDSKAISNDDFDGLFYAGFDAIVSNPPYLVLKPNKKLTPTAWAQLQEQINYFRKSGVYSYSIEGMLNLYQLSIESMLGMLKPGGELGVICPSTLFADLSATKLRKHLLKENQVRSIRYYAEKDDLFVNVIQATCIFHLKKGGSTHEIDINDGKRIFKIPYELISELFPEKMEIPNISSVEWGILRKLKAYTKLKDIKEIRCKRGELDLSIMKGYITLSPTPYRLVRGNMISVDGIKSDNGEYVDPSFLMAKSPEYITKDFGRVRLICQQISNAASTRRLVFCYCNENDILGNSCNYVSADPEILRKMEVLLNSPLLNWRFRITSSNNHINNYELDELPIVSFNSISLDQQFNSRASLSDYVCELYGLDKTETAFIQRYENI